MWQTTRRILLGPTEDDSYDNGGQGGFAAGQDYVDKDKSYIDTATSTNRDEVLVAEVEDTGDQEVSGGGDADYYFDGKANYQTPTRRKNTSKASSRTAYSRFCPSVINNPP